MFRWLHWCSQLCSGWGRATRDWGSTRSVEQNTQNDSFSRVSIYLNRQAGRPMGVQPDWQRGVWPRSRKLRAIRFIVPLLACAWLCKLCRAASLKGRWGDVSYSVHWSSPPKIKWARCGDRRKWRGSKRCVGANADVLLCCVGLLIALRWSAESNFNRPITKQSSWQLP